MLFGRKNKKTQQLVSTKLPPISFDKLPPDIASKLRQAATRIKTIIWMRGALAVLAALMISVLSIMAIDAMVMIYSSAVRWVMWFCGVSACAFTAMQAIVRPLARPFTPGRIAALIEQNHPELEERLSTVVELISAPGGADAGSAQLLGVLTDAAIVDVKNVSPQREFTNRTVKPKLVVALGALAILALLFAIWPESTGRLILRAVVPSAQVDNIYADNLGVTPGDKVILKGQPLAIELAIYGGFPGVAYLRRENTTEATSNEVVERMRQTSAETGDDHVVRYYQHFVSEVTESFRYRIACGNALTRFYDVTAVPIPAYKSIEIKSFYPAYTGLEPRTNMVDELEINAVAGTEVQITIEPERELTSTLILADGVHPASKPIQGLVSWRFRVEEKTAGMWSLELTDSYNFTNKPAAFPVRLVKDQVPTLELESPEKLSYRLPPYSKLPFSYTATDDFGLSAVEIRTSLDTEPFQKLRDAGMTRVGTGVWRGEDEIDLAKITIAPGMRLRVQLVARDNLPPELGGPNEAFSPTIEITIDAAASSMAAQLMEEQFASMDKSNAAIMDALEQAKKRAQKALDEVDRKADPAAVKELAESQSYIVKADDAIREMMANSEYSLFESLIPDMKKLLDEKVEPARAQADEAVLAKEVDRRQEVVDLIAILEDAIAGAKDFAEQVEEQKDQLEEMTDMSDLAEKQEALAEDAKAEMTPEEMEKWRQEQEALKNEFTKAEEEITAEKPLDSAIKKAEEIAGKIDELKKQQEEVKDLADKLGDDAAKDDAAKKLNEKTPDMPANSTPEQRAEELQSDIADQAEALNNEVSDMSDDFNALSESLEALAKPVADPLNNASDEMNKAQDEANKAAEEMKGPDEGKPEDAKAAESMEKAAEKMEAASEALKDATEAMKGLSEKLDQMAADAAKEATEAMQAAMDAAAEGAEPPPPADPNAPAPPPADPNAPPQAPMAPAAQSAEKAAEAMKSLAEQLAQQAGMPQTPMPGGKKGPKSKQKSPPMPGEPGEPQEGENKGTSSQLGMPDFLKNLGFSPADWFKTKGEMSSGALDDALKSVPPEYRELVKAYFIELSKESK